MNEIQDLLKIKEAAEQTAVSLNNSSNAKPKKVISILYKELSKIREYYKKLIYAKEPMPHAFEWLFDNYYIMEREGRIAIKALSQLDALPCNNKGVPAILIHAQSFCKIAAGNIDSSLIEYYINAAQEEKKFESVELSAFGLMLRAALIQGAARACSEEMTDNEAQLLLSDAVKTLNFLTTFDFSEIVEKQSCIEQILSKDPSGCYGKMDERSRAIYRKRLADIARKRKISESDAANMAVTLALKGKTEREQHVGYYIIDNELDKPIPRRRSKVYLLLLCLIPAIISIALGIMFKTLWLPFVLFLPMWEVTRSVIEYFIMKGVNPTFMPRLDLEGIIPEDGYTLVIISTLLSSPQKIEGFIKKLEQFYYSNGRGSIVFGVLADLKESRLPELPEDKAVRNASVNAIKKLNKKCGQHFFLFIRSRRLSETQSKFSGWERKRGAITELIRCIKGQHTSISTIEGDINQLKNVKYLITLDADTGLLMDSAAEMVSVAMHPLNKPEIDEQKGIVTKGYGILSPKMGVELNAAGITSFSRIMAGCGGVTAYDNAAGDIYQDLFSEGIFAGKGLIDIDAFYKVLDNALPENKVLSHDILEGCFLRAGYISDVELIDGFPARPGPWFDRLHRWIRGDWQNIRYIRRHITTPSGRIKTPFNMLSRFKLFDNLRRSITPIVAFVCLIVSAFTSLPVSIVLVATAILSVIGAGLWNALLAVISGGPSMLSRKYHGKVLPQATNSIFQGILSYIFLPYSAISAFDAVSRAISRQITGKKMLEWTTAADVEAHPGNFFSCLNKFWSAAVIGFAFLFLSISPVAKIAGAFWIITPLIAYFSGRVTRIFKDELNDDSKEKLHSYTAAMWRYYEDFVDACDNYLPPDNVQEAPIHVVAHRTSPTNIGLLLLSTLAARDLGLLDSELMFERISNTINTLEKLEKQNGNLYNWYDTRTLKPLRPRYISTVDSGNLVCSLIALREGCKDFRNEAINTTNLIDKIQKLIDDTDLSRLYNKRRKLFHIGYDVEEDKLSDIYYDLLMSEARMTSYYAIAKRIAPKRHWGALGRTLAKKNGYTGPVSWTGTMFEYMMPHLLLPVYEDSMSAEALRFALYCQKQRVKDKGIPWGISESGFYAFDSALNYQYKAHGVQKIALKRGMDTELVISPYSSFLSMPFDPNSALRNLETLEEMGMYGRCGFYEAADFTLKRTEGNIAIIKSYMAHHVGMSIVAAANTLLDGIMQERFMRDYAMKAAGELLQEKIPSNAVVFNDVMMREVPDKPGRTQIVREEFDEISPVTPRVQTVSNGEYTMVITDTGVSVSMFRGIDLIRRSSDLLRNPCGIYAIAAFDQVILPITTAPDYSHEKMVKKKVEFNSYGAIFHSKFNYFEASMQAIVHGQMPCEARMVELSNFSPKKIKAKLLLYFEPTLAKTADEATHPAFSKLFLNCIYKPDTKILIFARRPRSNELPAFLAVGFAEQEVNFEFETNRTCLLSRPEGIASLSNAIHASFNNKTGALPDAAAALRIKTDIPAHGKKSFTLLIAAANNADEASSRLLEVRRTGFHNMLHNAAGKDTNEMESRLAALILPQILFPVRDGRNTGELASKNVLGQQGLWSLGISGDYPIILIEYTSSSDTEKLEPYVKTHKALRLKGIMVDLVITYKEGGDYASLQLTKIQEAIRASGCEYLSGSRGGIHLVNLLIHTQEIYNLILAVSCHIASNGVVKRPTTEIFSTAKLIPAPPVLLSQECNGVSQVVYGGEFCDDSFTIHHDGETPFAPWCQVIANPMFGTIVSDRALGCTWAINARENKLTPWNNDAVADNRGEMILLKIGTRFFDLCSNAKVTYAAGSAIYETELGELWCKVTVSVPHNMMAKLVVLELENKGDKNVDCEAAYYTEPIMGVSTKTNRMISFKRQENYILMKNPWAPVSGYGFLSVLEDSNFDFMTNKPAFLSGKWYGSDDASTPDPCAAIIIKRKLPAKRTEKTTFLLGWSANEQGASQLLENLSHEKASTKLTKKLAMSDNYINIKTPDDKMDVLINHWLRWQFMSSRIMGRSGFYQCGGAWGFRDQLQDCCAALLLDPAIAKTHIYRATAHQFKEGDVMHWWHQLPPRDGGTRGVRTRCSDDLLWLPYTVCEYIEKTGDYSIFKHDIYYLEGPLLELMEEDHYFFPSRSNEKENVYLHCVRAIERTKQHFGQHNIPLFGNGDWNDGMNLVGIGGTGESVWLAMFFALLLGRFAEISEKMEDNTRAQQYKEDSIKLKQTIDEKCWDGGWYMRGFYDDGSPLGSKSCDECKIDLLPQSFATIADIPNKERRKESLDNAMKRLVDERLHIVKLFEPPFDKGSRNPGYIKSYPPGIRENGGQYTHAAVWFALSLLIEERGDDAKKIIDMLNPIFKSKDEANSSKYKLEPYVMAADIYSNSSSEGRGGWSFYTGAAGWYYRTILEYMLGLKIRADKLFIKPVLPTDWQGFESEIKLGSNHINIKVVRSEHKGLKVDGIEQEYVPLDGKEHEALLEI
jgi:cyclic beta-1,2-glucan synthetase